MTAPPAGPAVVTDSAATLRDRLAALEAERLAPVPRASHAIAVDADDLAVVLHHVRASLRATRLGGPRALPAVAMNGDAIAAYHRLEAAVASHTVPQPRRVTA